MTDIPDTAVIVVRALGPSMISMENARVIVAALAREYEFCPPGTLAEIERLRADNQQLREVVFTSPEMSRLLAALDAVPPTDGRDDLGRA